MARLDELIVGIPKGSRKVGWGMDSGLPPPRGVVNLCPTATCQARPENQARALDLACQWASIG
jgi:hypothetical protein